VRTGFSDAERETGQFGLWLPEGRRRPMLWNTKRARLRKLSHSFDRELRCHPHDSGRRAKRDIAQPRGPRASTLRHELKMPPPVRRSNPVD